MSLGNEFLGGYKGWTSDVYEINAEEKEILWRVVEPKFEQLLQNFREIKGTNEARKSISLLNELIPILDTYIITYGKQNELFQRIRGILLELWQLLLLAARKLIKFTVNNYEKQKNGISTENINNNVNNNNNNNNGTNNNINNNNDNNRNGQLGVVKKNTKKSSSADSKISHFNSTDLVQIHKAMAYLFI